MVANPEMVIANTDATLLSARVLPRDERPLELLWIAFEPKLATAA
jgi:hypothetical protein